MNACHGFPRDGVGEEEVAEYPGHVAELSDLQTVHRGVTVCENVLKRLHVDLVHLAQPVFIRKHLFIKNSIDFLIPHKTSKFVPLSHESKELFIGPLLRATIDNHVAQLRLVTRLEVEFDQLVN